MKTAYILGITMMFGLFGCAKPKDQLITIRGQQYLVPAIDYNSLKYDEDRKDHQYVFFIERKISIIKYELRYDIRDYDELSKNKYPNLFGVLATTDKKIEDQMLKFENQGIITYCNKDDFDLPVKFSCGIFIVDADVNWTVNFSKEHLTQSVKIKAEAENVLRKYREAAHAKRG